MEMEVLDFEILLVRDRKWFKVIDTALPSPFGIVESGQETVVPEQICRLRDHSVVTLMSKWASITTSAMCGHSV
jgi:isoamylase